MVVVLPKTDSKRPKLDGSKLISVPIRLTEPKSSMSLTSFLNCFVNSFFKASILGAFSVEMVAEIGTEHSE